MTTGLGTGEEELPLVLVARDIPDSRSLVDEVVEDRWGMPPEWVSTGQAAMRFPSAPMTLTLHDGQLMIESRRSPSAATLRRAGCWRS